MTLRIETSDGSGSFDAYVAEPEGTPRGAIVVIQEIFGVNPGIRKKCDDWAAGLSRAGARSVLAARAGDRARSRHARAIPAGARLDEQVRPAIGRRDIESTIKAARAKLGGGKVGVVGYCLGGRLAFMTATRTDSDASVGYYGVGIDNLLGEKHAIANPVLLHVAGADHFVTPISRPGCTKGSTITPR
jgi:carboxymethylenebutenolidase